MNEKYRTLIMSCAHSYCTLIMTCAIQDITIIKLIGDDDKIKGTLQLYFKKAPLYVSLNPH